MSPHCRFSPLNGRPTLAIARCADRAGEVGAYVARRYVTPEDAPPTVTTFFTGDGAGPCESEGSHR